MEHETSHLTNMKPILSIPGKNHLLLMNHINHIILYAEEGPLVHEELYFDIVFHVLQYFKDK